MAKDKRVEKVNFTDWTPFGPQILVGDIPKKVYKEYEKIVKSVLEKKEERHDYKLAGRIDDEWTIGNNVLYQTQTEEFLEQAVIKYCNNVTNRMLVKNQQFAGNSEWLADNANLHDFEVRRVGGWVNSMKRMEYNPLHHHPYCNITSIFFFSDLDEKFFDDIIAPSSNRNSDGQQVINTSTTDDGSLEIVYGSNNYWQTGSVRVRPKKGMFLIFPGDLLHCVYPFDSKKRRISASFNFQVHSNSGLNFGDR